MRTDDLFKSIPKTLGNLRYRIQTVIGSGSTGMVYTAIDSLSGDVVAVKLFEAPLLEATSTDLGSRFKAEARLLAKLDHARLIQVFTGGKQDGFFWFSMRYYKNGSLREFVSRSKTSPFQALDWTFQLLEGLGYIHAQGLVHRDIKPDNLLLDDDNQIVIADFGLARHPSGTVAFRTRSGLGFGSAGYRSPEMREDGANAGPRADVYSAAATLYFMVKKERPLTLFRVDEVPDLVSGIDPILKRIILKATKANPDHRYQTAREMAGAVAAAADQIQVAAGQPKVSRAWMRRFDGLMRGEEPHEITEGVSWLYRLLPWMRNA